jgi:hypothetical protein
MRVFVILFAVLLGTGCANYRVSATSPVPVAMPAPTGGFYLATTTTSGAVFLFGAMMIGALAGEQDLSRLPPPAMSADRQISEQDCTRPVSSSGGNLRCR